MSDDEVTYCIRGCVAPCDCGACRESEQPCHPPQRRTTRDGSMLCDRCARTLQGWLADIPGLYATLDPYHSPVADDTEPHGKRGKLSGSPALVRLDVLALQDPRTAATSSWHEPWDGTVDVAFEMTTWAALFARDHGIKAPVATIAQACDLLLTWHATLCRAPWIDECYDVVREVARQLNRAHGIGRPQPVGRCINVYQRGGHTIACGHALYASDGAKIKCGGCGRHYDARQMVLVRLQEQRDKEAAG